MLLEKCDKRRHKKIINGLQFFFGIFFFSILRKGKLFRTLKVERKQLKLRIFNT